MTDAEDDQVRAGRPVPVMVLIPTLGVGGAEMDLVRNLPLIDRSRFTVVVCAFLGHGNLAGQLRAAGIEVIGPFQFGSPGSRLPAAWISAARGLARHIRHWLPTSIRRGGRSLASHPMLIWSHLRLAGKIATQLRDRRIDVVHTILPNSYVVGAIACLLAKRPALIMSRVSLNWYQDRISSVVERWVLHRMVDLVICNSFAIQRNLRAEGLPVEKIRVIPNGIEIAEFSGIDRNCARDRFEISNDAFVLTMVASFHRYKGHADLLHALQIARRHLPPRWILLAAGRDVDGNLAQIHRLSDELGLSAHIRWLGERDDVPILLRASDIHVSASHTEGFPNNILEAMGASLPVIATAVGGVPELVVDGVTGILVPAHNIDAMARALVMLASDSDRRKAMGEAGRARAVSSFSIAHSAKSLQDSYEQLAKRSRS